MQQQIQEQQNESEDYVMPTERSSNLGSIQLPNDLQKWFFVIIIIGISSIFGILTVLQNNRTTDAKNEAVEWKSMYAKENKKADSLQKTMYSINENCVERVTKLRSALAKVDSITNSPKNSIKYRKLNEDIKTAITK